MASNNPGSDIVGVNSVEVQELEDPKVVVTQTRAAQVKADFPLEDHRHKRSFRGLRQPIYKPMHLTNQSWMVTALVSLIVTVYSTSQ